MGDILDFNNKYPSLPKRYGLSTRRTINKGFFEITKTWTGDTDPDDYMEYYIKEKKEYFNYYIINELLLLLQEYNNNNCNNFITFIENNKTIIYNKFIEFLEREPNKIIELLMIEVNNIIVLSDYIKSFPYANNFFKEKNKHIKIYRGFNNNGKIFNIINKDNKMDTIDNIITTPCFLSTSLLKITSQFFVSNNNDISRNIIWEIIIPYDKLKEFNYCYFGQTINDINNQDEINTILSSGNYECEILLNIGAMLQLLKISNEQTTIINNNHFSDKKYILYTYMFIGFNKKYMDHLFIYLKTFHDCLKKLKSNQVITI